MSNLDDAVQKFNDAAIEWAKRAQKLKEAQDWRDSQHRQAGKSHADWIENPSEANIEAEARSIQIEQEAEVMLRRASDDYQEAAMAYMLALAEFQTAIALATAR
jgi:hypothetical protein